MKKQGLSKTGDSGEGKRIKFYQVWSKTKKKTLIFWYKLTYVF